MGGLFKNIPESLPPKKPDDYKENKKITIRAVGGEWFIENMYTKIHPINRRKFNKRE